jgi:RimJ/RimL family protein N-acetyltransferase
MVSVMVEDTLEVDIRSATPADADRIARVHIDSWREAYADVVPADYLAALDVDRRAEEWRQHLSDLGRGSSVWVAQEGDQVLGFASLGPSTDEDADRTTLEIHAIYLEPSAWGQGVARELMRTVLASVQPGVVVTLWVLDANERARHFYRRNGFQPDGIERLEEIGGQYFKEIRYRRG